MFFLHKPTLNPITLHAMLPCGRGVHAPLAVFSWACSGRLHVALLGFALSWGCSGRFPKRAPLLRPTQTGHLDRRPAPFAGRSGGIPLSPFLFSEFPLTLRRLSHELEGAPSFAFYAKGGLLRSDTSVPLHLGFLLRCATNPMSLRVPHPSPASGGKGGFLRSSATHSLPFFLLCSSL